MAKWGSMQETSNTGAGTAGSRTIQLGIVDTVKPSDVAPVVYWATRKGSAIVARISATKNVPPLTLRLHAMISVHRTSVETMDCTCAILTVILLLA